MQVYDAPMYQLGLAFARYAEILTTLSVPTSSSDGLSFCETISEMKFAAIPMQPSLSHISLSSRVCIYADASLTD